MRRLPWIWILTLTTAGCMTPFEPSPPPPNVVLIMVDDLGWADLGCYGGKTVPTPHLDRLARQGVRFTQAYSGCVVCAPARSTLMTGQHMGHTSVRLNTGGVPLRDADRTLGELMRRAGFRTAGFGKWGLGDIHTTGAAERQGFERFFGYYHQIHAHQYLPEYLIDSGVKTRLPGNVGFYVQNPKPGPFPRVESTTGQLRQFSAEVIKDRMLDYLRSHAGEPFFCYAPWTLTHGEYRIPDDDPGWAIYRQKPWPTKAQIAACYVAMVDRHVGEVLETLDRLGIGDDTLVMFLSDHGAAERFEGSLDSCGPLRGRKRSMYEGGLRVPLIARWPNGMAGGRVSDHLCYFPDFFPTLAELVDAPIPEDIDGISFLPTLLGDTEGQQQHDALYWEWQRYDWKKRADVPGGLMQAVRIGNWKAIRKSATAPVEIYDLARDPGELHDVASTQPEVVQQMEAVMAEARTEPRPQSEPEMPAGRPFR